MRMVYYNVIRQILSNILDAENSTIIEYPIDASLVNLGMTSIQFIEFVVQIEDEYLIEIRDSDLEFSKFETIEKINNLIAMYIIRKSALKKVLICDCDDVLWRGVAGEDDIEFPLTANKLQKLFYELYNSGVLLCLCSKNTEENIYQALKMFNINKELFVYIYTNCHNKATAIQELAQTLNLSVDSFVFIDDSNYELGLIDALVPEILTVKIQLDNPDFLDKISLIFTHTKDSSTINNRSELYEQQKERIREKALYNTIEEYNESLHTIIDINDADIKDAWRIAELSQRTNQFNLSAARYSTEEVERLIESNSHRVWTLSASDRFGDMGIVGGAIASITQDTAIITAFFLSCRSFDRGFEKKLIDTIKKSLSPRLITGVYCKTSQNGKFSGFYSQNGIIEW